MQFRQFVVHLCLHRFRGLYCRTASVGSKFVRTDFAPIADHLFGHLDMALHGQMLADGIGLVRAMRAGEQMHRTLRQAESLAVPVE